MKTIYFIRHGESEDNVGTIRQNDSSRLTKQGVAQTYLVSRRCKKLKIDILISSPMNRALETADIISDAIGKPIIHSDLFVERRRPSEQIGKDKKDTSSIELDFIMLKNFSTPNFHVSDEENFEELKERASKCLNYLESIPEKTILVITHGIFIRILIAYAILGKDMTAKECKRFILKFHMENTGISAICYNENESKSPWWLWTWNNHFHLNS